MISQTQAKISAPAMHSCPGPSAAVAGQLCAVRIAGALIFAWVCDIIISSSDALFSDPVATFGRTWDGVARPPVGTRSPRKAKEFLFTSDSWCQPGKRTVWGWSTKWSSVTISPNMPSPWRRKSQPSRPSRSSGPEAVNKTLDIQGQAKRSTLLYLHHLGHNLNFRLLAGAPPRPMSRLWRMCRKRPDRHSAGETMSTQQPAKALLMVRGLRPDRRLHLLVHRPADPDPAGRPDPRNAADQRYPDELAARLGICAVLFGARYSDRTAGRQPQAAQRSSQSASHCGA